MWPADGLEMRRLARASHATRAALAHYVGWIQRQPARSRSTTSRWDDRDLEALIERRAFDGLDGDDILAIGWQQLEEMHVARREAGRDIDPDLSEEERRGACQVEWPGRRSMRPSQRIATRCWRARRFVEEHDLATLPQDDVLEVLPTPTYMRSSIPLAAYFEPAAYDRPIRGVYIVTPSVDGDAGAMREHNWSSIVNTSVHEAYPGHHQQFSSALSSATPSRLLTEAPEFTEGWGMYCEQMMLEAGFEDTPERRVIVATDAIWRACRIILDIRLQRGEISIDDGHRVPHRAHRLRAAGGTGRGPSLQPHARV